MRMKIITIFSIIFILGISLLLIFLSQNKNRFYKDLLSKSNSLISKITDSIELDEKVADQTNLFNANKSKVVVTSNSMPKEIRYYYDKSMIAIDYIDESGKVIRRDLLFNGKIRIQLFYNFDKNEIQRNLIDDKGKLFDKENYFAPFNLGEKYREPKYIFLPTMPGRTGY